MMSVYAVMIKDAHGNRWIDSLWVRKFAFQNGAEERISVLKRVFEAMNANHTTYIVEMKLEDGELADPSKAKQSDTAKPQIGQAEEVLCS